MSDRLRTRIEADRQDGFTLIELLIVIVILGILAGIVVFAVGGITDRGTVSACKADKKTVQVAVEAYYAQTGGYPTGLTSDARIAKLTAATTKFLNDNSTKATIDDNNGTVSEVGC
jgi:prepilin-type N-terminal cleavage/methylation domain-containing protein